MRSSAELKEVVPAPSLGRDLLVRALEALDVRRIFGVMGDGNLAWLSIWAEREGNHYVSARHEGGAVAMADGLAWQTGEPGVSTVTYGPGVLHAMNALATAHRGGAGHVLITSTPPASNAHHLQRYDHAALVAALGAVHVRVESAAEIPSALADAYGEAASRGVAVVVDIADECFAQSASEPSPLPDRSRQARPSEPPLPREDLLAVAELLGSASSPVLLAGVGAERAGAGPAIARLAERTGALLATTLAARGLFAGHPQHLGVFGGFSTDAAKELLAECDAVVAFGAGLNEFTTDNGALLEGRRVAQIDRDASAVGRRHRVELPVVADATTAAEALIEMTAEAPDRARRLPGDATVMVPSKDDSDASGIDPRVAMHALDSWLPDDRIVITDGGHFIEWPSRYLRATGPGRSRAAVAGGSIAIAPSQAMGVATAGIAACTMVVVGDGGFFMALTELETAVRERIPVIIAVIDDAAYSAEVYKLRKLGLPERLAYFDEASDIVELSRALGAEAHRVSERTHIDQLPDPLQLEGPLVIDIRVTRAVASSRLAPV